MNAYEFKDGWYEFWQQEYVYNRRPNLIRCRENQAPMSRIAEIDPNRNTVNDDTWSKFKPATDDEIRPWLEKFGPKFGYTGRKRLENRGEFQDGKQMQIFPEDLLL